MGPIRLHSVTNPANDALNLRACFPLGGRRDPACGPEYGARPGQGRGKRVEAGGSKMPSLFCPHCRLRLSGSAHSAGPPLSASGLASRMPPKTCPFSSIFWSLFGVILAPFWSAFSIDLACFWHAFCRAYFRASCRPYCRAILSSNCLPKWSQIAPKSHPKRHSIFSSFLPCILKPKSVPSTFRNLGFP